MIESINTKVRSKLETIGFEQDKISAIEIIHELKTGKYPVDISEFVNSDCFEKNQR